MSSHVFKTEEIRSWIGRDGRLIVATVPEKDVVEFCPMAVVTSYWRRL